MAKSDKNLVGLFFSRILMATLLVVATYNPTPFSLLSYLGGQLGSDAIFVGWAFKIMVLVLVGIGWWVFLKTAYHSLKGIALAVGLILMLGAYIMINQASEWGYSVGNGVLVWAALLIVSFLLGVGATASHVKRRWAGISNVEEVDHA